MILAGIILPVKVPALAAEYAGSIFLDVEKNGEAWYVNPETSRRHYLGRPEEAFELMRSLGLGISEKDFTRLATSNTLKRRLAGSIVLRVESLGEAYYINPRTLEVHSLGRPHEAFVTMTRAGIGIRSAELAGIPVANTALAATHADSIFHTVPFVAQAPLAEWSDARQQEGCEEASVMMAMAWVNSEGEFDSAQAREQIITMSNWQKSEFGYFEDTSAHDTATRLFNRYFNYENVRVRYDVTPTDVHAALKEGKVVVLMINGKKINHNYYVPPGPDRHAIVVHGFDATTGEFLTHDPGTQFGANHRMTATEMDYMMRDYTSGVYAPIVGERTAMIVVSK